MKKRSITVDEIHQWIDAGLQVEVSHLDPAFADVARLEAAGAVRDDFRVRATQLYPDAWIGWASEIPSAIATGQLAPHHTAISFFDYARLIDLGALMYTASATTEYYDV